MRVAIMILVAAAAYAQAVDLTILNSPAVTVRLQDNTNGGLNIVLTRRNLTEITAVIGRQTVAVDAVVVTNDTSFVILFSNNITLRININEVTGDQRGHLLAFTWDAPESARLEDCVNIGSKHWYGGPQQKEQYWPIERLVLSEYSYVTKEADNCGIAEPYWLSSDGIFYYFDSKVPLFIDQNNLVQNATCFIAEIKAPYSNNREQNDLIYTIGIFEDVRKAHEYAVENYLGKPTGIPDERMITYPVWSTWARYKRDIDHNLVLEFADEISSYGFPNSQFEIDDLWEICYGSLTVDVNRFPNMQTTVGLLKARGYRVTMWAHPFINRGCEPWYSDALSNGYLVISESSSEQTSWWNDNGTTAAYIDFTKSEVRNWYVERLRTIENAYGIDSFKFDAGETSWSPQIPILQGNTTDQPGVITTDYVRTVAQFGPMTEVRSGLKTQDLPIFVRVIDKDTYWTFDNGLPTLITTVLQMNMNGYVLVLPDMIGGNGYNEPPSKELFIRWLQANTFMPALQFSYVPWDFDNETIQISKEYVDLHAQYSPYIIEVCRRAVTNGEPVNPPIWWIAPNDTTAHSVWDQYLLGENILVAPVVTEHAISRDIYLPEGTWLEEGDVNRAHEGPTWLRNYSAPLDVLPYFVRQGSNVLSSATNPFVAVSLVVSVVFVTVFNT